MIASMWIGNLMLIFFNLPMVGIWVRCCRAVSAALDRHSVLLLHRRVQPEQFGERGAVHRLFGVVGYLFVKLDCEPAPMLLGFLLGPMMEVYMRRAMLLSRGDPLVFVTAARSACHS